ncbi:hypothetical protein CSUB01_09307 [Colletotrichum sublineola]|uniref:Major facilitator superfamily transporter n=1 Tax=Colletotrichum sublineola TaxID=1173701 RepID=A0A066X9I9_COLSU|nr:hypothetical protein CSUB01_09307 [Colletotrichum sublineola]
MSVTAAAGEKTHPRSESPPPREPKASATTAAAAVVAVQDAEAASHPPPDGGPLAWLQVAGSFFLFFNSWSTYYQAHMTDASVDAIAWIGSIQSCLLLLVGVLVGPLYDAGYFRSLILTGTVLVFVGMAATSFTTRYWQTLLAQAFCVGLGAGCLYIPSVAIIPQYFSARRALATGIATTGSGFGGVIYSLIVQGLLQRVGFPLGDPRLRLRLPRHQRLLLRRAAAADQRPWPGRGETPPPPRHAGPRRLPQRLIRRPVRYSLVYGLAGQGSSGLAYYLVAILNAGSVLGRMFPAWLAGRYGPINVLLGVSVSVATVTMCWLAVRTGAGSVVFALAYGFATGGLISCHVTKRYR